MYNTIERWDYCTYTTRTISAIVKHIKFLLLLLRFIKQQNTGKKKRIQLYS